MSLVKKSDQDESDESKKKKSALILKSQYDESKPKRYVKVLDEETFITKLETIIEKSFFPDLERLKVQKAYQEALKTNNMDALRELYSKYNRLLTPGTRSEKLTRSKFMETPNLTESKKTAADKEEAPYANEELSSVRFGEDEKDEEEETLDQFLAKNTSEDNVSFEMLMKEAEKKKRSKTHQAWLYEKEQFHKLKAADSMLMIEDSNKKSDDVTKALDSWTYTSKNTLMFVPDGAALTAEEELAAAKKERKIMHENTRINTRELFAASMKKPSSSSSDTEPGTSSTGTKQAMGPPGMPGVVLNKITKIGIDGKESAGRETPKIGGYSLVTMTPSPMPGRSLGDESPAMVWGEIESTPFRLDPSMTPYTDSGPEFKMPSIPEREKIALNLEEKASNERRKRKDQAMKQMQRFLVPSPRSSSSASPSINDKLSSMSPAARRLLEAKLNVRTVGGSGSTTPSPSPAKFSSASPSPGTFSAASPSPRITTSSSSLFKSPNVVKINNQSIENLRRSTLKRPLSSLSSSSDSLTDNLLKLPKNT